MFGHKKKNGMTDQEAKQRLDQTERRRAEVLRRLEVLRIQTHVQPKK